MSSMLDCHTPHLSLPAQGHGEGRRPGHKGVNRVEILCFEDPCTSAEGMPTSGVGGLQEVARGTVWMEEQWAGVQDEASDEHIRWG